MRAFSPALALCSAALVLFVTLTPVRADTNLALPVAVPEAIVQLRLQPALGPTVQPPRPGEQVLSEALLANYVKRQQELRSVDVTLAGPQPELTTDHLLGYIGRGSFGAGNTALSAIASFTRPTPRPEPTITPDMLAAYVVNDYRPPAERMKYADAERDCLAQAIYHEARGESANGQLAVANVIVNRARSPRYPSSLCGVVYQNADQGLYRCQFTFACDGKDDTPTERRAWASSKALAAEVYRGFATGEEIGALPKSALFYHTTAVAPTWSNTFNRVATIDSHIFYAPN